MCFYKYFYGCIHDNKKASQKNGSTDQLNKIK